MKSLTSFAYKTLTAFVVVMVALTATPVTPAFAATSGPNNAGTGTNVNGPGTINWTNPGNVLSDNNAYVTATVNGTTTEYLQATNYGFTIPAGATINGITVTVGRFGSTGFGNDVRDSVLSLIKGGVITGSNFAATGTDWPGGEAAANYGGIANLWGTTWTPAEINAANFGVAFSATSTNNRTASVDYIQITITYTLPATTTALTSDIDPSTAGQTVTFTATVLPATATGTVNFLDNGTPIGSGTLAGGVATFSTSALTVGAHNITAAYLGDTSFSGSTSAIFVQDVNGPPTIISANNTTFTVGSPGTFTVIASGSPTPNFILTGDPLPAGVNFNTTTGVLSGTPTLGTNAVGIYNLVITATNGIAPDATQNFTLTVNKANQNITQFNQPANVPNSAAFGSTFSVNPIVASGLTVDVAASGGCAISPAKVVTMTSSTVNCVLTATQAGNGDYNAAPTLIRTVTAGRANTTVSVNPDPSQSFYSQPFTFNVTVSSTGGIPDGSITFLSSSPNQSLNFPLVNGVAQITISNLNVATVLGAPVAHGTIFSGTNPLRFTYNPAVGSNFNSDFEETSHTVYPAPTQVNITSNINPSAQGQSVIFTITVSTTPPGTGTPPGTVTLYDNGVAIPGAANIPLIGGVATFTTSALTFGTHPISALYTSTNTNYATSNNTATPYSHTVARVTTTALTSNNTPSIYGENVIFTATVNGGAFGTPTGTVQFYNGAVLIGTGTLAGGTTTFTTNSLIVGTHPITARYVPSVGSIFATSTSSILNQVVNKATLDVTADNQTITYGDADPSPFTFTYNGFVLGQTAVVIDTPPTCDAPTPHVNAGAYPGIIVCSGGLDNNYDFNYIDGNLTVTQKALTITADNQGKTFGNLFTFNGTEFTPTGLINADTVTSVTLTSAGAPAAAAAGAYPIIPSAAVGSGLTNYTINYVNGTMTVGTNVLTIFANNQTKIYGDVFTFVGTEFTVVGLQPGTSVTSVTLTSAGSASAADVGTYPIVPSAAVGVGLGSYTIVYSNGSMDVNQRTMSFNPNDQTKVYGSVFSAYTGAFTGLRAGDNITPIYDSAGAAATAAVGVYPINVTLDDPDGKLGNYIFTVDPAPAATLTVTPKALTITASNQTKAYGTLFTFAGTEFTTAGLTNGDTVTSVTLASAGEPAAAPAGTYPIVASAAIGTGLSNYTIGYVDGTLTVTRPDLIVTSDGQSKVYGDVFTAFTGSIVGIQNGDNITATYASAGAPAAAAFGTYPITITLNDPDGKLVNYNVIQNVGTLSVTRRDLTVVADNQTKLYGGTVALTGVVTGVQPGDNITFTYSSAGTPPTAPVGTYSIAITLNDPLNRIGNYNFTLTPGTLTVTQRDLVVTPDDKSKNYGDFFLAFTGTITGIQNGDNISANYASTGSFPAAAVGPHPITTTLNDPTGKLGNYNVIINVGTLTVGSSVLTVTADNKTITYGDPDPAFTFAYFGFAAGDTAAVVDTPPTCTVAGPHTDIGTYPIVCSGGVDNAYTFTYIQGTLTVAPRALVVTPTSNTKVYGDVFTAFTGTVSGVQAGDTITATYASTGAPAAAVVGAYPITATLNDPGNRLGNYTVTLNTGTLTVITRALTVTPGDKTKVYGDVFTAFTGTITGIQNADAITAIYSSTGAVATATVAGSPYPITAILNAPAGVLANYTITVNTGDLTVTQRTLVVTPDNKAKIFGTVFNAFTGVIAGIQAGDNITATYASTGAPAAAAVGTYPITATLNDPANRLPNYTVTLNTGTLNVALSVLNVTAENKIITYGDPDPAFTFTYTGFVAPDTAADVDTQPSCQVSVPHNNVGTFPITCAGGVDNNYAFSYTPGTLTVTPRALTVTPDNKTKIYGDTFALYTGVITGIQGGDNITATYASTGAPATATVAGSPYPITATLNDPGNRLGNYTVTLNTGNLTVTQRPLSVTPNNANKLYGSVFNAFTGTIVGIQNGDAVTATYASTGSAATAVVGTYPITATLNAPAGVLANYNVTSNTGTLTVDPRDLVVQPADKNKIFGTVFTAFTGSIVGIQNGDNITAVYASTGAPAAAAVGDYPITATLNDPANRLPNYTVSIGAATLSVTLANQTITVTTSAPSNAANGASFTVAATASSGLAVTYTATGSCTNVGATFTINLPNGTCVVRYNQAGNANFNAAPEVTQNVTALANAQTITVVTSAPAFASPGGSFDVEATASSGLPVSITVSGICTVVSTGAGTATVTMISTTNGTCDIRYNQAGDANFASAPQIIESTAVDSNSPTVTVNQQVAQVDPTNVSPINFTVVFSEAVTGFVDADITIGGTAGATTAVISGAGPTYTIAVSGMTTDGTVTISIAAGAVTDNAGNPNLASTSSDNSVMYFDGNGPTVEVINTSPNTGDATLIEAEVVTVRVTKFMITFNQDVYNPAGDSDPDDVTNPNNYMLVRDLGDLAGFQTVSCNPGAVTPDDTQIAVNSVTYDSNTFTATISVNSLLPLSNGTYRLYICGTTSIVDPLNNALALVGAGAPSTDFLRNFLVNIPTSGGGGGGGGGAGGGTATPVIATGGVVIPVTGFAPDRITKLPAQPADKAYKAMGDLTIEIPTLGIKYSIVGVSLKDNNWDLTWLKDNVGYLEGSAYPTFSGNTVLTAHVLDSNNNLGPFSDIKGMQLGDKIFIRFNGQVYAYEVQENRKIRPFNISAVFEHEEYNWLTLVTCEDYVAKSGKYSYRRMVRAVLVSVFPEP